MEDRTRASSKSQNSEWRQVIQVNGNLTQRGYKYLLLLVNADLLLEETFKAEDGMSLKSTRIRQGKYN